MSQPTDKTVGQPKRATDSRPRPGSETPELKPPKHSEVPSSEDGERKPSSSSNPINPRRPIGKS